MTEKTKVYVDPYRKKYGSPTMPSQKKGYDRKEKVKAMNELARETTKQVEEEQSIDDLIQEAKAEGNFKLPLSMIILMALQTSVTCMMSLMGVPMSYKSISISFFS